MLTEFRTIPKMDNAQTKAKMPYPHAGSPRKAIKQKGVYEPAINKNIEQWSKIRKTFFALLGLKK